MIYGLAVLALSFLAGQWLGELVGSWLGINANVGGVGFAMIILMLIQDKLERKGWMRADMKIGIDFWNRLYIPVVIAMASVLNVKSALSSGSLALVAGVLPVFLGFAVFPYLIRTFKKD
ncbi:malonate transporter subunit MadL [Algoriphagus sp. CAU 1675]|uniref:malonate transporter subunit MadL n=1 Tax=Algoriphagus sp. CAU 1675 TaxID=3032597 RepID=UPI0023DCB389|nr:malonate transporter subunit MadL [Algoriphagus sp. CAU 1675]MDF2157661.1 malonate transporter subunit MadL [Algoriphagus sp. CAU 1675]